MRARFKYVVEALHLHPQYPSQEARSELEMKSHRKGEHILCSQISSPSTLAWRSVSGSPKDCREWEGVCVSQELQRMADENRDEVKREPGA